MAYDPSIFNINPYYDDFDSAKGFLRVLFKPGYAVQARELTQLQSILQDQLSRAGDHLFKDGSRIVGGGITVRNSSYLMVGVGVGTPLFGVTDFEPLVGAILTSTNAAETTKAKVVGYLAPDSQTDGNLILIVDFYSGSAFSAPTVNLTNSPNISYTGTNALPLATETYATGSCKVVSVSEGIFYINGFFVKTALQQFTPYQTSTDGQYRDLEFASAEGEPFALLSKKIGFSVTNDNVTEQEDSSLRDPAIGSYNYNAPGADRYKIVLTLGQANLTETPSDFVELLRFEAGRVTKKVERVTYGEIENALARRTYDESGSYTVRPFDVQVKASDATNYTLNIGSGKAYVFGKEVENGYPQEVTLPKARTTLTETAISFPYAVGNYIDVSVGGSTNLGQTFADNLAQIASGSALVRFLNNNRAITGTARIHGALPISTGTYRVFLHGISGSVTSGRTGFIYQDLATGWTLGAFFNSTVNTNLPTLKDTADSALVYEIKPGYAIKDITSLTLYGKLVSDDLTTISYTSAAGGNPETAVYTVNLSSDFDTLGSSVPYRFKNYGTATTTQAEINQIGIVNNNGQCAVLNNGTLSSSGTNQFTLTVTNSASNGWAGFTADGTRVIVPVIYSPDLSVTGQCRTKTSTATTDTFRAVADKRTDASDTDTTNAKVYYEFDHYDVYAVTSVIATNTTDNSTTDVTADFELDDGQKESFYGLSRLYLKSTAASNARYSASNINLTVSYLRFVHGGLESTPFIGALSYGTLPYEKIPLFTNPKTGKTVSLANCLDFRHSGPTAGAVRIKPYGGNANFTVEQNTSVNYTHYLPRIDKLCVKADPDDGSALFFLVQGTPDLSPVAPPDPQDALVVSTITVPAYTHNTTDVILDPVETKRFTMADIGKLEKRVDDVEVFAKLSLSESEIESRSLRAPSAPTATEPLKTSIFVDEFYGHSVGDVTDPLYSCSIDFERGEMRPFFTTQAVRVTDFASTTSGVAVSTDGVMTLIYDTVPYIENQFYTKTVKINPSNTVNWLGYMNLSSTVAPFFDTGYRPLIKTNSLMENDNWQSANPSDLRGFGTQWNDWESIWTGIEEIEEEQDEIQKRVLELPRVTSDSAIPSRNSGSNRIGANRKADSVNQKTSNFIKTRKLKNRIKYRVGSRIVDRSVLPFIPQATITGTVHGLKPNATGLSVYFDGTVVTAGVSTDANGSASFAFGITAGTYTIGEKTVRISDSAVTENASIAADAVYYCNGVLQQRDNGCISVLPSEVRRQSVSSEAVSKDPFNRDIDSVESTHWSDPLSQTFFVDKKVYPDGLMLKTASLYFAAKDDSLPVTVQIRPTVSGYPSPSVVVPFSTVTKKPSEVTAAATSPQETVFEFSSPVYLEPGEYALCVLTNSDSYELFAADSSYNTNENTDAVGGRAGNNQSVGTLFVPQGIGAAVADNSTDLMFSLGRCDFSQATTGFIQYPNLSSCNGAQVLKFYAPEVIPTSCSVSRSIGLNAFKNNETIYPTATVTGSPTLQYTLNRGNLTAVSPMVYLYGLYGAAVTMTTSGRYVSRVVELGDDIQSRGLAVFVDENTPAGTSSRVYYRYSETGEDDIFSKPWLTVARQNPTFVSTSELDYREGFFRVTAGATFGSYQVRVDSRKDAAPDSWASYFNSPSVKNIRVVSFI
jgi:hypothetical protein